MEFRMSVWILVNVGDSIRSAVSSSRSRSGPVDVSTYDFRCEGDSALLGSPNEDDEDVCGGVIILDSTSRASSSSRGGNKYGNHCVMYLSCSVAPSTCFLTSSISSRSRSAESPSFTLTAPKTSSTALLTFSMICEEPRCSN